MMLIDPPAPFAPTDEWEGFLVDMRAVRDGGNSDPDVQYYIEEAARRIGGY